VWLNTLDVWIHTDTGLVACKGHRPRSIGRIFGRREVAIPSRRSAPRSHDPPPRATAARVVAAQEQIEDLTPLSRMANTPTRGVKRHSYGGHRESATRQHPSQLDLVGRLVMQEIQPPAPEPQSVADAMDNLQPAPTGAWARSSHCSGGDCVEVQYETRNASPSTVVASDEMVVKLRDSKDPDGPVLTFTQDEWQRFILGAKAGNFDVELRP
jgi:hypothetical protein